MSDKDELSLGQSKTTKDLTIRRYRPNDDEINCPSLLLGDVQRARLSAGFFVRSRTIWIMINNILRDIEHRRISIEYLQFTFDDEIEFYDAELYEPKVLDRASHLIWYRFVNCSTLLRKGITRRVDFQYFNIVDQPRRSVLIKIERKKSSNPFQRCRVTVTLSRLFKDNGEPRPEAIELIADDIFASGVIKDLSGLYEQLKGSHCPKRISFIIRKNYGQVIGMKRWKYRRGPLNVLHEMVTNFWEGPGWILQLKKEEYNKRERRSFWKDLALVIYQEVLCPIYQYCTFLH